MINAITGASTEDATQSIAGAAGADKDMFLQLLVAQVKYQDPLEPMNNNEAMAQTAQFTMVEQMTRVAEQQNELLSFQQATLAAGLIGRSATGIQDDTGAMISGVVTGVEFNQGDPQLVIDGKRVGVDSITSTAVAESPNDDSGQTTEPDAPSIDGGAS